MSASTKGILVLFLRRLARRPAVLSLIAILLVVFVAQLLNSAVAERLSLPGDVEGLRERLWSPVTVMFVHDNVVHIAVMVLMLAAFGTLLEEAARAWDVLAVYVLSGLAGSIAALAAAMVVAAQESLVGASAAVFGVAAALFAMRPSDRILGGKATQWLAALVAFNIIFLFSQPVSAAAHLAGLAVGVAYGRWLMARSDSETDADGVVVA